MAYNQQLQNALEEIRSIIKTDLCLFDSEGNTSASTIENAEQYRAAALDFAGSSARFQVSEGSQYFKIPEAGETEYILMICSDEDDMYTAGRLAALQIKSIVSAYREKYDKENFIKNVLLDNMLQIDMYNKARRLHIEADVRRVVFVIETSLSNDRTSMEIVKSMFGGKSGDFVTAVDEGSIIVVKKLEEKDTYNDLHSLAQILVDLLNTEAMSRARIAYGNIVNDLKDVSGSYKEAKMAMEVGRIFYSGNPVAAYNRLGIGRLIYQLPVSMCKMFIDEIFPGKNPGEYDDETLLTINRFFENSLNVSETSRQLYIHRNTLIYRLDKVNRETGLDLRVFDDAVTFRIALMVVQYIKYMEEKKF